MATPQPLAGGRPVVDQRGRLGVVDYDQIGVEPEVSGSDPVRLEEVRVHLLRDHALGTVERGVDRPARREELGVAAHDLPARLHAQLVHDLDEPRQGLDHPATIAGGAHVGRPAPPQPVGEAKDQLHGPLRGDGPVVLELQHRRG